MTIRVSQRLIASSFIVGTGSVFLLFVHFRRISGAAPSFSWMTLFGAVGWTIMIAACATVILHRKPEATFLGRFALQKEPLLRGTSVGIKRVAATLAVVAVAVLAFIVTVLAWTGNLSAVFEKYVFP
jgi:hypothetical protein